MNMMWGCYKYEAQKAISNNDYLMQCNFNIGENFDLISNSLSLLLPFFPLFMSITISPRPYLYQLFPPSPILLLLPLLLTLKKRNDHLCWKGHKTLQRLAHSFPFFCTHTLTFLPQIIIFNNNIKVGFTSIYTSLQTASKTNCVCVSVGCRSMSKSGVLNKSECHRAHIKCLCS